MAHSTRSLFSRLPPLWRRRPLLLGLGVLLVLELLYNAVLTTGLLEGVLNHFIQESPSVEWTRAWSLVPGSVHVRGLKLRHAQGKDGYWQLEMDEVTVGLSLFSLFQRKLRADSVDVRGLHVRIHPPTPEPGEPKPQGPLPSNPWQILLHGVHVHEISEVDWKDLRMTGIAEASGDLELVPRQRVSVKNAQVKLGPGQIAYLSDALLRLEGGSAQFSLEARRQEGDVGLDLIAGLTDGRLQFTATHPALEEIPLVTSHLKGMALRGGAGRVEVDLQVKDGTLAPGTQLKGSAEPLTVTLGSLRLKAPWRFLVDVYPQEGESRLGMKLTLGPVRMDGGQWPSVETREVNVLMAAQAPRLDQNPRDAHLELHTEPLHATWGGAELSGQVHVDVDAKRLSLNEGKVALHGSHVRLQDVTVKTGNDEARHWNGLLTFPEATVGLVPPSAQGRFTGSFSSAAPFVALLTFKGTLPRVLSPLLGANNLKLSGDVDVAEKGFKLSRMHAEGEGLELRCKAESAEQAPHAVLWVKMGILSLGVETGEEGTHVQVLKPGSWYEDKTGERTD
jgi:hypothetical protein